MAWLFPLSLKTYQNHSSLWVDKSSDSLFSKGIAQGDPLSMLFYALEVLHHIPSLSNSDWWVQSLYADEFACVADIPTLKGSLLHCVIKILFIVISQILY